MAVYKLGIIGYGGFGKFLYKSWKRLENVKIVAVADQDASCNPGGTISFYNRWQDLIKVQEIDIVSIVTPPSSHAEIACAAMQAGKHVIIEKPIAITIEDGKRIIAMRDQTGKKAIVDYMLRFNPIVETLALLSHDKAFGELRRVDVENYAQDSTLPPEHWFWKPDIAGGILIEHAVHFIDLVHSLTNESPRRVTGLCHSRNRKQEDRVLANVLYDNGLIATHYHAFARPAFFEDTTIRLSYDLAQIDIEGWIPLSGKIKALVNTNTEQTLSQLPGFKLQHVQRIDQIEDASLPGSWGNKVRSGGVDYFVEKMISGGFDIGRPKLEVYSDCLCFIIQDLIKTIENPDYSPQVTLEDGLLSLEIAILATESGRKDRSFKI